MSCKVLGLYEDSVPSSRNGIKVQLFNFTHCRLILKFWLRARDSDRQVLEITLHADRPHIGDRTPMSWRESLTGGMQPS
jgi:hypothetical protein